MRSCSSCSSTSRRWTAATFWRSCSHLGIFPLSKILCSPTRPRWRAPCSTLMSAAACCISRKYAHQRHAATRCSALHFSAVFLCPPCMCFCVLLMWCIRWGWAAAWTSLLRILAALTTTIARRATSARSSSHGRLQISPACSLFHPWFVLMIMCFCFIYTRRVAEPAGQEQRRSTAPGARCHRSSPLDPWSLCNAPINYQTTYRHLHSGLCYLCPHLCFTPGSNVQIHVAGRDAQ